MWISYYISSVVLFAVSVVGFGASTTSHTINFFGAPCNGKQAIKLEIHGNNQTGKDMIVKSNDFNANSSDPWKVNYNHIKKSTILKSGVLSSMNITYTAPDLENDSRTAKKFTTIGYAAEDVSCIFSLTIKSTGIPSPTTLCQIKLTTSSRISGNLHCAPPAIFCKNENSAAKCTIWYTLKNSG